MRFIRVSRGDLHTLIVKAALVVVAVHLVGSALFFMDANIAERLVWAGIVGLAFGVVVYNYGSLSRPVRGSICLGVGLSALVVGATIHVARVIQVGVTTGDPTGLAMLVAGLVLTVAGLVTLVRIVHAWWRRLLLIPAGVVFAFFVIFPVGLAVFATNVARVPCCDTTPADHGFAYEDVTFTSAAGHELSAWYIPTQNGAVVIMGHGAGKNRETAMPEARVLARNGYGVLLVDLEGFGDSEGRANAFGWTGARGVHAAIDYLRTRPDVDPERIGGLGLSMGGEVLLQAAGESPLLKAVVSEGGTGRTTADFGEIDDGWFQPIVPFHKVVGATMRLISGEATPPPLKEMVQQIGPRRVLLIAGNIGEEKELMGLYLEVGGPSFEMWTIPEPKHVGAYDLHPEEYEERVIAFLDGALLGDGPRASSD
jgi:pimeloyl-ACP methyl ester carboxylesterase